MMAWLVPAGVSVVAGIVLPKMFPGLAPGMQPQAQTPALAQANVSRMPGIEPHLDQATHDQIVAGLRGGAPVELLSTWEVELLRAGFPGAAGLCRARVTELTQQMQQAAQIEAMVNARVAAAMAAQAPAKPVVAVAAPKAAPKSNGVAKNGNGVAAAVVAPPMIASDEDLLKASAATAKG